MPSLRNRALKRIIKYYSKKAATQYSNAERGLKELKKQREMADIADMEKGRLRSRVPFARRHSAGPDMGGGAPLPMLMVGRSPSATMTRDLTASSMMNTQFENMQQLKAAKKAARKGIIIKPKVGD